MKVEATVQTSEGWRASGDRWVRSWWSAEVETILAHARLAGCSRPVRKRQVANAGRLQAGCGNFTWRALGCSVASSFRIKSPATTSTMSSISFPHAAHDHTSSVASSAASLHESEYFASFGSVSGSSFQMNPLSQHPPRTPRTSIVSSSHVYGGDIYTPKEEVLENQSDLVDEEDAAAKESGKSRVRTTEVWRDMFKTSYGRDKAFVSIKHLSYYGC